MDQIPGLWRAPKFLILKVFSNLVNISVHNHQSDIKISQSSVKKAVKAALLFLEVECDEVAIHFVKQKKICALHAEFFADPTPTDCISFPYDSNDQEGYCFLGEVFICPKTAKEYVEQNGGSVYEEITLYLVHGLLHLLGYDDIKVNERKKMRIEEKRLLGHLNSVHSLIK